MIDTKTTMAKVFGTTTDKVVPAVGSKPVETAPLIIVKKDDAPTKITGSYPHTSLVRVSADHIGVISRLHNRSGCGDLKNLLDFYGLDYRSLDMGWDA